MLSIKYSALRTMLYWIHISIPKSSFNCDYVWKLYNITLLFNSKTLTGRFVSSYSINHLPYLPVGGRCLGDHWIGGWWRHGLLIYNSVVMVWHPSGSKLMGCLTWHCPLHWPMHWYILKIKQICWLQWKNKWCKEKPSIIYVTLQKMQSVYQPTQHVTCWTAFGGEKQSLSLWTIKVRRHTYFKL